MAWFMIMTHGDSLMTHGWWRHDFVISDMPLAIITLYSLSTTESKFSLFIFFEFGFWLFPSFLDSNTFYDHQDRTNHQRSYTGIWFMVQEVITWRRIRVVAVLVHGLFLGNLWSHYWIVLSVHKSGPKVYIRTIWSWAKSTKYKNDKDVLIFTSGSTSTRSNIHFCSRPTSNLCQKYTFVSWNSPSKTLRNQESYSHVQWSV